MRYIHASKLKIPTYMHSSMHDQKDSSGGEDALIGKWRARRVEFPLILHTNIFYNFSRLFAFDVFKRPFNGSA